MQQNLHTAFWEYSNKKAKLISNNTVLLEIEFLDKIATVKFEKNNYQIRMIGFWFPSIVITLNESVVAIQKGPGLWGTKSEFILGDQTYVATTTEGKLYNIVFTNNNSEILVYKLVVSNTKPVITFEVKSHHLPEDHLFLLLALGFYSIKNTAIEILSSDFIVLAAS